MKSCKLAKEIKKHEAAEVKADKKELKADKKMLSKAKAKDMKKKK